MPPQITQEVERLQAMIGAIEDHLLEHDKVEAERDRKGEAATNEHIVAENCWTEYIHNSCVVWDKHATGPHNWRWVAELFIKPVGELRAQFSNDDIEANYAGPRPGSRGKIEERQSGEAVRSSYLESAGGEGGEEDALASCWKVWDLEHRRILYIHEPFEDKPLDVQEWPHRFLQNAPPRMLFFELEEDEFKPIPPAIYIWDQQQEINRYRTKAGIQTRRDNRVMIADQRCDAGDLERIAEGEDGVIVQLQGMGMKPKDAVAALEFPKVSVDVYQLSAIADDDIQKDSGLGEVHLGGGIRARTATAAEIQEGSVGVTLDMKLEAIHDFVEDLARDLRALMRQYYTEDRFVELFWEGSKNMEAWRGSDLEDYEIKVEMGSSMAQDQNILRMQLQQAVELGAQVPGVDIQWLFKRYLETFPHIRNPEEAFQSQPEQAEQMVKPGIGPGRGQGQQALPGNMSGTGAGAVAQPARDMTK
jgi:hypothetical protein